VTEHGHHDRSTMMPTTQTRDERLALAAAKTAGQMVLEDLFGKLGVNVADFEQLQELRDDIQWVHQLRTGSKKVGARFVMTIVSVVAGAIAIAMWEFFRTLFHFH
jgi:hypothetical protein